MSPSHGRIAHGNEVEGFVRGGEILLHDAGLASRSRSKPILFADTALLAQWASDQAGVVAERDGNPLTQSRYAGLIQSIGGDPGKLLAYRFRGELISNDELAA